MPAISIIIPVFNAADTLERCVSSVLAQSFNDWELFLVDDGSSDGSREHGSKLQETDPRILCFSQEHGGVSSARNLALERINGHFVCFIDADDVIEPDYLSTLYNFREYDLVVCGYFVDHYSDHGSLLSQERFCPTNIDLNPIYDRALLLPLFLNGMIHINCNKLLHTDIIRQYQLRYPCIPINEDYEFMLSYLEHCQSIKTIPVPLYHWTRVKGRVSGLSTFSFDQIAIYNNSHLLTTRYFNSRCLSGQISYYSYYWLILKYLEHIKQGNAHFEDLANLLQNDLLKESFILHKPSSLGEKGMLSLLKHKMYRLFYLLNRNTTK